MNIRGPRITFATKLKYYLQGCDELSGKDILRIKRFLKVFVKRYREEEMQDV